MSPTVWLLGAALISGALQIPSREGVQPGKGAARIRGRVVAAATGQPVRRAQVVARSDGGRDRHVTRTDGAGRYEFTDLPAGRYTVEVRKGGFVGLAYGQKRPFEPGKPIEVSGAEVVDRVDIALPPGAVITGRVIDEIGEPVTDVRVVAMQYRHVQGRRQLRVIGPQAITNDVGEYRVFGLSPGPYMLAALQTSDTMMVAAASSDRSGYASTYYPGTADASQALPVALETGQALANVDITLVPARLARVSGTATRSDGTPFAGALVMVLHRNGRTVLSTSGTQVRPDGSFTLSNLAPGEYELRAMQVGTIGGVPEMAAANLSVAGDDVAGVSLVAVTPTVVSGRVVVDTSSAKRVPTSGIRLVAAAVRPEDEAAAPLSGEAMVNADDTFELKVRPGHALIRAEVPAGWMLKAIRHNGTDVTDTGMELRQGEPVTDVEIVLTHHTTDVSGTVISSGGDPVHDYTVIVFSTDSGRWGYMSRFFRTARPDSTGRFKLSALPPGEYYAIALDYVEPGEASDPELLERLRGLATRFRLGEGESKALSLKIHR